MSKLARHMDYLRFLLKEGEIPYDKECKKQQIQGDKQFQRRV